MTTNPTTCPYCFQPRSDPSATPSIRSSEDDLDGEIKRTEDLISRLYVERSRLCKKRNERRSRIYSLPPENLASIFQYTCPPLDFLQKYGIDGDFDNDLLFAWFRLRRATTIRSMYPQVIGVLSAVSAYWNSIVSSTPSLWASYTADDKDLTLMKNIFSRSGNLPISARLESPQERVTPERGSAVSSILQKHASRIFMLHVSNASPTWVNQHLSNFTGLKYLSLIKGAGPPDSTLMSIDNSCTHLVLKGFECPISLSWSKIQVLHLLGLPTNVCLEMLEKCTQLVEYRVRTPSEWHVEEIELPSSPFILPRLKHFQWQVDDKDDADRAMLQYISMPALETLAWWYSAYRMEPSGLTSGFFERLPLTLYEAEIGSAVIHDDFSGFSYFLTLPNVERLVFKDCAGTFMDDVFTSLGSRTSLIDSPDMLALPKLQSIYIENFTGHLDQDRVLETLQSYCSQQAGSLPDSVFRLEFRRNRVHWTPEFKEGLVRMVEQGCRVELWVDSEPVEWLPRSSFGAWLALISL